MLCGPLEGVMELISDTLTGTTSIEVRVRGPRGTNKACFFFMEELLGIVDQVVLSIHNFTKTMSSTKHMFTVLHFTL